MRRWLVITAILILILTVFGGFSSWMGLQQPVPTSVTLLHLNECKAPCWIGIIPGKTLWPEAETLIRQTYDPHDGFELKIATSEWHGLISSGETQSTVIRNEQQLFSIIVEISYEVGSQGRKPIDAIYFAFFRDSPPFIARPIPLSALLYALEPPYTVTFYGCCQPHNNEIHITDISRRVEVIAYADHRLGFNTAVATLIFFARGQKELIGTVWDNRAWKGFASLSAYELPVDYP